MDPLISVVIPTYNNARYVRQAVESVFAQTYPHHEVIVVDDGSKDDPRAVLVHYLDRICFVRQENAGASAARNRGLGLAQGEFVVLLDADDYLLPEKFERQLACFQANPALGAVHSGWRLVMADGTPIRDVEPWHDMPKLDLRGWLQWKPVFLGAMLYRRTWLERAGPLNTLLKQTDDVDLILRMALLGCPMAWLRQPTVCRRKHDGNITRDVSQQIADLVAALDIFFSRSGIPGHVRRQEGRLRYAMHTWLAWFAYSAGETTDMIACLRRSRIYAGDRRPTDIALDWTRQFANHNAREGQFGDDGRKLLPLFQAVAEVPEGTWDAVADRLRLGWWFWHWYGKREGQVAPTFRPPQHALPSSWLPKGPSSRLSLPFWAPDLASQNFDSDAVTFDVVRRDLRQELTGLYLTAMGQAIVAQRWRAARSALTAALRTGACSLDALPAWRRFLQMVWIYIRGI